MSAPDLIARRYHAHGHQPTSSGRAVLDYEARFLRRKLLILHDGRSILADLAQTTSLDHGGVLITEDGDEITIEAAVEPLLEITGADLVRIAWHIGNRHTPCQIEPHRLLIQRDHVIVDMLRLIGAEVTEVSEPFTPEGGAYGHGRTHGHDHSHVHGPVPHSHD